MSAVRRCERCGGPLEVREDYHIGISFRLCVMCGQRTYGDPIVRSLPDDKTNWPVWWRVQRRDAAEREWDKEDKHGK
jgi:hypothetical protein